MERTEALHKTLERFFGFTAFKENQLDIINSILDEKDTFVLMPTGGGKSLCYQLPALVSEGTAIIISPLIALMKNQVDSVRACAEDDGIVHLINSSLTKPQIERVYRDLKRGVTKMLYIAPESLAKGDNMDLLKEINVSFYAVDEAHCISEWGNDFRPVYREIRSVVQAIAPRPIIALTATATPIVKDDIVKSLGMLNPSIFVSSFNRPNLYYEVREKKEDIDKDIIQFVKANEGKSGVIYCMSRQTVETFSRVLQANNIKALPYHAGIDYKIREETQDAFISEKIDIIVATIAFGMGIDKPDVRYVIHYDLPKSLESYYQETGRAGRDGLEGNCLVYYSTNDAKKMEKLLQSKNKSANERELGKYLLEEVNSYLTSPLCRRKFLLRYFGEIYEQENCHNCDNCKRQHTKVEAKEVLKQILEAIVAMKSVPKTDYLIDFVKGKSTADIQAYKHDELEEFGCCMEESEEFLNSVLQEAQVAGYITKNTEKFGSLEITKKGKSFLKKPVSFKVVNPDDEEADELPKNISAGGDSGVTDPALYAILKDLRKKIAREKDLPPYVIFQDGSLQDMAGFYPTSMEELQNISGVGKTKAEKFGEPFVKIIAKYVRENDIEKLEDIRIRTIPNKSKLKVSIVQLIDRKVSLEDIANTHNLDFNELLDEIDAIVNSGTKININYFIEDVMDEDCIDDIYDYFKQAPTDDLETAISLLGDCEEEEIRLVRIKFLSEMAN